MSTTTAAPATGRIVQVIGPVIDVEYEGGHLPAIYNAVRIFDDGSTGGEKVDIIAEVEQHLGEGGDHLGCVGRARGWSRHPR